MKDVVFESVSQPRFTALLLTGLAAVAMVLGGVGLYGTLAYSVEQRRREIGLRVALGASRGRILRLVLSQALVVTIAGTLIGQRAEGKGKGRRRKGDLPFALCPLPSALTRGPSTLCPYRRIIN